MNFEQTNENFNHSRIINTNDRLEKQFVQKLASTIGMLYNGCFTCANTSEIDRPLVYVNSAFETYTGYSFEDFVGRNCSFLQGPKTDPYAVELIRSGIEKRAKVFVEILNYKRNGTPFYNRLVLIPFMEKYYFGLQNPVLQASESYTPALDAKSPRFMKRLKVKMNQVLDECERLQLDFMSDRRLNTSQVQQISENLETLHHWIEQNQMV